MNKSAIDIMIELMITLSEIEEKLGDFHEGADGEANDPKGHFRIDA